MKNLKDEDPIVVLCWIFIGGGILVIILAFIGVMIWKANGLIP